MTVLCSFSSLRFAVLAAVVICVFWRQRVVAKKTAWPRKFWATLPHQLVAYKTWPVHLMCSVNFTAATWEGCQSLDHNLRCLFAERQISQIAFRISNLQ